MINSFKNRLLKNVAFISQSLAITCTTMKKLLLLHGALGCSAQFSDLVAKIDGFESVSYEFPGHGKKGFDCGPTPSMKDYAQDLLHFMENQNLKGCIVFGHSMGGYCAALCEKIKPNTFERIITLGTKWEWSPEIAQKETSKLDIGFLKEKAPAFIDRMIDYHGEDKLEMLFSSIKNVMIDLGNRPPLLGLEGITIPIEIYRGDTDRMVSKEESEKFANTNSLAKHLELPETKHAFEEVDENVILQLLGS